MSILKHDIFQRKQGNSKRNEYSLQRSFESSLRQQIEVLEKENLYLKKKVTENSLKNQPIVHTAENLLGEYKVLQKKLATLVESNQVKDLQVQGLYKTISNLSEECQKLKACDTFDSNNLSRERINQGLVVTSLKQQAKLRDLELATLSIDLQSSQNNLKSLLSEADRLQSEIQCCSEKSEEIMLEIEEFESQIIHGVNFINHRNSSETLHGNDFLLKQRYESLKDDVTVYRLLEEKFHILNKYADHLQCKIRQC